MRAKGVGRVVPGCGRRGSGVRCVGFWRPACSASSCGQWGTGVRNVGVLGSACPASGCRWWSSAGGALGGGDQACSALDTGWASVGSSPRPQRKNSHGQPCRSMRRELVVLVQRKPQNSDLKLLNSVLLGRNRWKALPRALVPLAGDMGTASHTFSSCPEATASSPGGGLRLNTLWLGSRCIAVLESSSVTRATVCACRCCFETRKSADHILWDEFF
ncbi:uncharacterized protein isoform X1 [Castor canadensis]|uniref:Uncharacterized protein isoform X1 n=16 Tax=Castor canadensis TaxID=51338 RepID=A0AC58ML00_CASCN